jgi:hypothetical protein
MWKGFTTFVSSYWPAGLPAVSLTVFLFLIISFEDSLRPIFGPGTPGLISLVTIFSLVTAVALFVSIKFLGGRLRADSAENNYPIPANNDAVNDGRPLHVTSALFDRCNLHQRQANISLFLVIMVLSISSIFMIFAGSIASFDRIEPLSLAYTQRILIDPTSNQQSIGDRSILFSKSDQDEVKKAREARIVTDKYIQDLQAKALKAIDMFIDIDKNKSDTSNQFISSIIIRTSYLVITLYIVIILFKNYRYHSQMSNIYFARFAALSLSDVDAKDFLLKAAFISGENLDFGEEIKHPIYEIVGALANKLSKISPRRSRKKDPKGVESPSTPTG